MTVYSTLFLDVSSLKNVEMSLATLVIMVGVHIVADGRIKNMVLWRLLVNAFVKRL
jgi:hypothetical protein